MFQLIFLFILLLIATFVRYLISNEFDQAMFALIFLLPVAAGVIYLISKRVAQKEREYQPNKISGWSVYNGQNTLLIEKSLFKGNDLRGYVKKYYSSKWNRFLGDMFNFYLSLEIKIDKDIYDVRWVRVKKFSNRENWKIYKNGREIGEAHTLVHLKNIAKLKEAISVTFDKWEYQSTATTVKSVIQLNRNDEKIGTLKRNHLISNVLVVDLEKDSPEQLIALILHSNYFKSNK